MSAGYLACSFDLLNIGDLDLITQASTHCSRLTVGVFSDEFHEAITGRPPVVPLSERLDLVSHVRGVADVVVHDSDVAFLGPDTVVFEVADRPTTLRGGRTEVLAPARRSRSVILRDALRSQIGGESHDAAVA